MCAQRTGLGSGGTLRAVRGWTHFSTLLCSILDVSVYISLHYKITGAKHCMQISCCQRGTEFQLHVKLLFWYNATERHELPLISEENLKWVKSQHIRRGQVQIQHCFAPFMLSKSSDPNQNGGCQRSISTAKCWASLEMQGLSLDCRKWVEMRHDIAGGSWPLQITVVCSHELLPILYFCLLLEGFVQPRTQHSA